MLFALLTLLAALSLAAIAGWFSIAGVASIYAGAVLQAYLLGAGIEFGKLVMISWLYRNWKYASWILKGPMLAVTICIMMATSMSVFGFLSKAHLQQGAATLDNGPKIERLDEQIAREKSRISDDEKVITQLDATVNSFIGKDNGDRALQVRRSQNSQRNQLRADINAAQKSIDQLNAEKAPLASEVKKLELDVGPIKYIGELIYGADSADKNIESAVKLFSGLIVLILDPSAVMLLIAFNHTILRLQNEKEEKEKQSNLVKASEIPEIASESKKKGRSRISNFASRFFKIGFGINEERKVDSASDDEIQKTDPIPVPILPETLENVDEEKEIRVEDGSKRPEDLVASEDQEGDLRSIEEELNMAETEQLQDEVEKLLDETIQEGSFHPGVWFEATEKDVLNEEKEVIKEKNNESDSIWSQNSRAAPSFDQTAENTIQERAGSTINEKEKTILENIKLGNTHQPITIIRQPSPTRAEWSLHEGTTRSQEESLSQETMETPIQTEPTNLPVEVQSIVGGSKVHFVPLKARNYRANLIAQAQAEAARIPPPVKSQVVAVEPTKVDKYPRALSWLTEFERPK